MKCSTSNKRSHWFKSYLTKERLKIAPSVSTEIMWCNRSSSKWVNKYNLSHLLTSSIKLNRTLLLIAWTSTVVVLSRGCLKSATQFLCKMLLTLLLIILRRCVTMSLASLYSAPFLKMVRVATKTAYFHRFMDKLQLWPSIRMEASSSRIALRWCGQLMSEESTKSKPVSCKYFSMRLSACLLFVNLMHIRQFSFLTCLRINMQIT